MMIGSVGDDGEDSFSITLCTAAWVAERTKSEGIFNANYCFVVDAFDYDQVEAYLAARVAECEGDDWDEVARRLQTFSSWEFAFYQEFEDPT